MDQVGGDGKDRPRRPVRNKRYNRRTFDEEKRPPKRLFTPEIKKFLKDWLVRRRDNPYPNRDEKKSLAFQTGLTYIQVCNWFANWRRKLKNAGKEPQRKTWGHLIKTYNTQVQGNVEHFSICSDDSIWHEPEITPSYDPENQKYDLNSFYKYEANYHKNSTDHCYTENHKTKQNNNNNTDGASQCFFISSTTTETDLEANPFAQQVCKYKNHIMEKYLRDCQKPENQGQEAVRDSECGKPSMISKWLESAANFRPSQKSYLNWTLPKSQRRKCKKPESINYQQHGREELDAAEALTRLANAYNSRH